jgi:hypothetical protein
MPGPFPQTAIDDLRGVDFLVAAPAQQRADVVLDQGIDAPALVVPEHHPRRFFLQMEQIQRLADAAMIALFGLFEALEIEIQRLPVRPGRAVDALQLPVARIAAPVGAGELGQLEGPQKADVGYVWPATHVDVVFMDIQRNVLIRRDRLENLDLVGLAPLLEHPDRFITRNGFTDHIVTVGRKLEHARLDALQVLGRKRPHVIDVVVEPILHHRPDGHLGIGVELLDGLTEQMGAGGAHHVDTGRIPVGNDLDACVLLDRHAQIDLAAIDATRDRCLRQARTDVGGNLGQRGGRIVAALTAVGKGDRGHMLPVRSGGRYEGPHVRKSVDSKW